MPDAVEHSALLLVTDVGGEGGRCGAVSRSSAEVRPANSDRHPTSTWRFTAARLRESGLYRTLEIITNLHLDSKPALRFLAGLGEGFCLDPPGLMVSLSSLDS